MKWRVKIVIQLKSSAILNSLQSDVNSKEDTDALVSCKMELDASDTHSSAMDVDCNLNIQVNVSSVEANNKHVLEIDPRELECDLQSAFCDKSQETENISNGFAR